jgi:hypothetical protein
MKTRTLFLSSLIGIILFACGGGGGGGTGGTSNGGAKTIYSPDYLSNDMNKTYTFTETEVDTLGGQQSSQTSTLVYSYAPNPIDTIPSQYGYSGTITGPYSIETLTVNGTPNTVTYKSPAGYAIISDNFGTFTSNEPVHTTLTGNIPSDWTVGEEYSQSSTEDLLNSDANQGTFGEKLGSKATVYTVKILGVESVTVANVPYDAIKTLETFTYTIILDSQTKTIETSATSWYGKGIGFMKKVANSTIVYSNGTVTSAVTDDLTSVSP